MKHLLTSAVVAALLAASPVVSADETIVDFEDGDGGWEGPQGFGGATVIDPVGGNPGANLHTVFSDFGVTFRNSSNPAWVQDLSKYDSVRLSMDLQVVDISGFGGPVPRPWLVEIRDFDNAGSYPWVSVYYLFDWVGNSDWTTWSVTIDDPSATEMPAGWGGTGAEDPVTFEPMLPEGRTFADVLAGADEIAYTTYLPGYFFTQDNYDLRLDNIAIETIGGEVLPGDVNGDGVVDTSDLLDLLAAWGDCAGACPADFDGDGAVGVGDLLILLGNWS